MVGMLGSRGGAAAAGGAGTVRGWGAGEGELTLHSAQYSVVQCRGKWKVGVVKR